MAIDFVALKNELNNDPASLGYAPYINLGDDTTLAGILNFVRNGSTPCPLNNVVGTAVVIRRKDISSAEIILAIDVVDYPALPTNPNNSQLSMERRYLSWMECLANVPQVRLLNDDGSDTPVISNFLAMFPAGTNTRARLQALSVRSGSRAELLFGMGTSITADNVAQALRRT